MNKFLLIVLAVLVVAGVGFYITSHPPSAKDRPDSFRFEHYKSNEELSKVLKTLLPTNTDQETVEKLLVDVGRAKNIGVNQYSKGFHIYSYRPWYLGIYETLSFSNCSGYVVEACYQSGKLNFLRLTTPCVSNTDNAGKQEVCNDG